MVRHGNIQYTCYQEGFASIIFCHLRLRVFNASDVVLQASRVHPERTDLLTECLHRRPPIIIFTLMLRVLVPVTQVS